MQTFLLGTNFIGQATPTKIKPKKICTDEKVAEIITVGYLNPQKFIPMKILPKKYCEHENFCLYDIRAYIHTHLPLQTLPC